LKTVARILLLVLALLAVIGVTAWRWTRATESPAFAVAEKRIAVRTKPSLAVGRSFAAMVAPDGTLWAWSTTELDLGVSPGPKPQKLGTENNWKSVTAGFYGLLALKNDGSLWAIGKNVEGLLGLPSTIQQVTNLTQAGSDKDWKEVKAGVAHCLALKADGSLWAWGKNGYGQIGIGTISTIEPPTRIASDTNWLAISPGSFTSYALKQDGTIWEWGIDALNQNIAVPGKCSDEANWTEIAAGDYHIVGRKKDGTYWIKGANAHVIIDDSAARTNWTKIESATNWVEIYCGQNVVVAKTVEGNWTALGELRKSKLPNPFEPLAIWTQCGTTLILMPDGRLWTLGRRAGQEPRLTLMEKIENNLSRAIIGQTTRNTPDDVVDARPFPIWEQVTP
jgi:alpha-tubulin suppressor-like RCC1 family protein